MAYGFCFVFLHDTFASQTILRRMALDTAFLTFITIFFFFFSVLKIHGVVFSGNGSLSGNLALGIFFFFINVFMTTYTRQCHVERMLFKISSFIYFSSFQSWDCTLRRETSIHLFFFVCTKKARLLERLMYNTILMIQSMTFLGDLFFI